MRYRSSSRFAALIAGALAIFGAGTALAQPANQELSSGSKAVGQQELPVPKITIYPGDVISNDALGNQLFGPGVDRLPVIRSREAVVGKVARRTLLPGKPIPLNAIQDASVIKQGKSVKIVFEADGLTITSVGVALQSGGVGEILSVRNVDSGMTIRGTVQANGTVKVDGP